MVPGRPTKLVRPDGSEWLGKAGELAGISGVTFFNANGLLEARVLPDNIERAAKLEIGADSLNALLHQNH
jgi:hypothetical protein